MGAIPAIMDSHNLGRSGPADHVSQEMSDQPQNGSGGVDDAAAAVWGHGGVDRERGWSKGGEEEENQEKEHRPTGRLASY